jgi:hypothetical protein
MSIKYKVVVPLALGALLAAGCNKAAPAAVTPQPDQTAAQGTPAQPSASQKFTEQPYYNMSYLISGDTLSADAQTALTGFSMDKKTLPDGTTQITLTALEAGYHNQQYILHTGDQLYFIEKFLGDDDNEAKEDHNMGDDEAVVVDSQGNVIGQPAGWTATGTATTTPPTMQPNK